MFEWIMTRFDRLDRLAGKSVDHLYAEPLLLTPMVADPNGRPRPDAGRPVCEGKGVFGLQNADLDGNHRWNRIAAPFRTMVPAKTPTLGVGRDVLGDAPTQGDVVELPERGERYGVVHMVPDFSRLLLVLTRQGRER